MQSGITASKELLDAFNSLVTDSAQRGLLAGIEKEKLVPLMTVPSTSSDFSTDLVALDKLLKDNEAAYVILRRYPDAKDGFVAVTYVPDTAHVRSKMLFASTRLTLVRELGSDKFRETLFATTKAELTADGFKKYDSHGQLKAPLTEEEQTLQSVKDAEAEASRGTSSRSSHVVGVHMPVSAAAQSALKSFGSSSESLLQLKIDVPKETIDLVSVSNAKADALSTAISSQEPRYSFFKFEHDFIGESVSPVIFIYTCPGTSKVKERMVYATSRLDVCRAGEQEFGMVIAKKIEATDPSDLNAKSLYEDLHPARDEKAAFSRPKRPGRK